MVNFTPQSFSCAQVTTTSLPAATRGVFYSQQLQASGGQQPYTWSLAPGSAPLPSDLSLSPSGLIFGTPAVSGTFGFRVRVAAGGNCTADMDLALTINRGTASCTGDCDGSGDVTVNELITMVNIALGNTPLSACTAGDADGSGDITINEIIAAVNNALNGC